MASSRPERAKLRAAHLARCSEFIETWRLSIPSKADIAKRTKATESTSKKIGRPLNRVEVHRWVEATARHVKSLTYALIAAMNSRTLDAEFLDAVADNFKAVHPITNEVPKSMSGFFEDLRLHTKRFPEWTIACVQVQAKVDEIKGRSRVFASLKESGAPSGIVRVSTMSMLFTFFSPVWKLSKLQAIPGFDIGDLFASWEMKASSDITEHNLETLNKSDDNSSLRKALSSSCLTSKRSTLSTIAGMSGLAYTQATSISERNLTDAEEGPPPLDSEYYLSCSGSFVSDASSLDAPESSQSPEGSMAEHEEHLQHLVHAMPVASNSSKIHINGGTSVAGTGPNNPFMQKEQLPTDSSACCEEPSSYANLAAVRPQSQRSGPVYNLCA